MKKLLTLLPLTLFLCGCSAFAPVVLQNNTIAQSQNASFVGEPKRVITPTQFQTYTCEIDWTGGTMFYYTESNGERHAIENEGWGKASSYSSPYCTCTFWMGEQPELGQTFSISVHLNFAYFGIWEDRFEASFDKVNQDTSRYTTSTGGLYWDTSDVDDTVEMFLYFEGIFGQGYQASFSVTFPMVYLIEYETFGTIENNSSEYVVTQGSTSKTFNGSRSGFGYFFYLDELNAVTQIERSNLTNDFTWVTMDRYDAFFGRQLSLSISNIRDDCVFKISALPYVNGLRGDYDDGYSAGVAEGNKPVSWFKNIFDGMASFFSVQIIPNISLGLIMFSPLLVLAIIVIVRIFKHGG